MLGMMLYIDNFAGNLKGVQKKLDYIKESNVSFIHLMPFLDTVKGKSDGGYAVADFRKVLPGSGKHGTIWQDLPRNAIIWESMCVWISS